MRIFKSIIFAGVALLIANSTRAQNLVAMQERYAELTAEINGELDSTVEDLRNVYRSMLVKERARYKKKGDLDGTLALTKELERMDAEWIVPDSREGSGSAPVQKVQAKYYAEVRNARKATHRRMISMSRNYLKSLERVKKKLVQADRLDHAVDVDEELDTARARLRELIDAGAQIGEAGAGKNVVTGWQRLPKSLREGLVLYYDFDADGGGSVVDVSGSTGQGKVEGATWRSLVKRGGCFQFDGRDSYIVRDHSDHLSFDQVTMSLWVKMKRHSKYGTLVLNKWTNAAEDKYINVTAEGQVQSHFFGTSGGPASRTKLAPGRWYHVVAVYNGNGKTHGIFIDGELEDHVVGRGTIRNAAGRLFIGRSYDRRAEGHDGRPFNGLIDDVMIYNRALSEAEVKKLYRAQK